MALDPEIKAMMTADVYVAQATGASRSGDPVYAPVSSTPIKARVEPSVQLVRSGTDGEDINSSHMVLTDAPLTANDKLWLPGTDTAIDRQARIVRSVAPMYDEDGTISHYEVLV